MVIISYAKFAYAVICSFACFLKRSKFYLIILDKDDFQDKISENNCKTSNYCLYNIDKKQNTLVFICFK